VPWIANSPPERVIAATPIGLCGEPPGIIGGKFGYRAALLHPDGLVYFPMM
jgi:hypothetical protein